MTFDEAMSMRPTSFELVNEAAESKAGSILRSCSTLVTTFDTERLSTCGGSGRGSGGREEGG